MNNSDKDSRINKFEKRRKTTKSITILLLLGSVLIIVLLLMWIFGGNDKESKGPEGASSEIQRDENDSDDRRNEEDTDESTDEAESDKKKSEDDEDEDKDEDEVETEKVEPSDDNVTEAYTGNWKAVGTEQSGSHTTNYDEGSQDRIEMESAIQLATGLDDMTALWIGNGGDQKVIATVSSSDNSEIYRVYLSWIEGEGWQPAKVEELKESDV